MPTETSSLSEQRTREQKRAQRAEACLNKAAHTPETFHRAVCAVCGTSPDGDGSEYQMKRHRAVAIAHELGYIRVEDGRLLCPDHAAPEDDDE